MLNSTKDLSWMEKVQDKKMKNKRWKFLSKRKKGKQIQHQKLKFKWIQRDTDIFLIIAVVVDNLFDAIVDVVGVVCTVAEVVVSCCQQNIPHHSFPSWTKCFGRNFSKWHNISKEKKYIKAHAHTHTFLGTLFCCCLKLWKHVFSFFQPSCLFLSDWRSLSLYFAVRIVCCLFSCLCSNFI